MPGNNDDSPNRGRITMIKIDFQAGHSMTLDAPWLEFRTAPRELECPPWDGALTNGLRLIRDWLKVVEGRLMNNRMR